MTNDRAKELARIQANVSRSLERDPERAIDSYTNHTATALRKRVLAASNGHPSSTTEDPR